MPHKFLIIFVTYPSKKEANSLVNILLKNRLIACASMIPGVYSRFWWHGQIEKAKEVLLVLKGRRTNFAKIEKLIRLSHSYEVPEIIAIPIVAGSKDYLKWLGET